MPAPKGRRTGRCQVCNHDDRYRIEMLIVGGAGRRAIGSRFDVSPDAVWRHSKHHMDDEQKARLLAGPVKLRELADRAAEENLSLIDYLHAVRSTALSHFFTASEAGDTQGVALLTGRLTELLRLQGQVTHELTKSTSHVTNNTLVLASPVMADIENVLLERLRPYPAALKSVFEGIEALRQERLGGQQRPVLEHASA